MSVVGTKEDKYATLRGYENDPLHEFAEAFMDVVKAGIQESSVSLYEEPVQFFRKAPTNDALKRFFLEDSYDPSDPRFLNNAGAVESHLSNMEQLYENDREVALQEASNLGSYNPVIGMALPMHKNLLMNAVFDQVMPKDVARSPKFTLTLERRLLIDTEGNEIDMFLEQNKMKDAIENSVPRTDIIMALPENETTNVIAAIPGVTANSNTNLSLLTRITGLVLESWCVAGDEYYDTATKTIKTMGASDTAGLKPVVFSTDLRFAPYYGDIDRTLMAKYSITVKTSATETSVVSGTLTGYMKKNKFMFMTTNDKVTAVKLHAVIDVSSAAFPTCKTKWDAKTTYYEIPEAPHVTCTISPEEVKDIQALYDVNQITKLMSMMRLALLHWKDDKIHDDLDTSFENMDSSQKVSSVFDFVPPVQYLNDPISWRSKMFMDQLDIQVTKMLQVLNDENMTVVVFGRPDIIRRIAPQEYTYATPSNIGPVELDFHRTVVTSEKRVYNFISSQKLRNNNNLIVLLIPRNTMRITYKIIDYQLYISNEIRDTENYQLPGMTCFERWYFLQYQPVQGRVRIVNPTGLREQIENSDPIGTNAMNDFTANGPDYASTTNGVVVTPGKV